MERRWPSSSWFEARSREVTPQFAFMILFRRAVGAALLRRNFLLDISLDQRATADAALLVSGVSGAVYLWDVMSGRGFALRVFVSVLINSLMVWIVMAGLTSLVGKLLSQSETRMPTVMRLQGFCYLPLLLAVIQPVALLGRIWFLVALVVATAEALETVYWRAAVAVAASFVGLLLVGQLLWGGRLF